MPCNELATTRTHPSNKSSGLVASVLGLLITETEKGANSPSQTEAKKTLSRIGNKGSQ